MTLYPVTCPQTNIDKSERIQKCLDNMSEWISSEPMNRLISLFDGKPETGLSFNDRIEWLNNFCERWDYRKSKERWEVSEDPYVVNNADAIFECVKSLGLVDEDTPHNKSYDFILPLGGANLSNQNRPQKAREIIDRNNICGSKIVALSGTRSISDAERPNVDTYAPKALTEFDAISQSLEAVFSLNDRDYSERKGNCGNYEEQNINLNWVVREYNQSYNENQIYSLAAPSSNPERRANSLDTFEFFLQEFNVAPGSSLLLVTTCIYVPFQLMKFMDLAIEKDIYVDCIGVNVQSNYTNYLQETKATINAIKAFSDKWSR